MKYEQIINDLKNKVFHPIYVLSGEESYYIDLISDYIEDNVLSETERDFNLTILYGRDVDVNTIVSNAKRYPMMSEYQVVIVKEAQSLKNLDDLESYIKKPLKSTILVICYKYKKLDKRKTFAKTVKTNGVLFESPVFYDNQIPDWIMKQGAKHGLKFTPKASVLLQEFIGSSLSKLSNEISKIKINEPKGGVVNDAVIEENIGISKDYNVFELQNALGDKNILKANQIINYFAANKKDNPMIKVIAILFGYFNKVLMLTQLKSNSPDEIAKELSVHRFFVKDYQKAARTYSIPKLVQIIELMREYDLKSKGVGNANTGEGELMKELVYKILH